MIKGLTNQSGLFAMPSYSNYEDPETETTESADIDLTDTDGDLNVDEALEEAERCQPCTTKHDLRWFINRYKWTIVVAIVAYLIGKESK